jgi:hypothetical protein
MLVVLMVLTLCTTAAARADANPVWGFSKVALVGNEVMVGAAIASFITVPGATTQCEHFLYNMKIFNLPGEVGKGEITELPLFECITRTAACTVKSIQAEKLPWPTHLAFIPPNNYLIIEGINIGIVYGGELCPLAGALLVVKGSAGGLIEEKAQTITFDKAISKTTGTVLKVGAAEVEWNGVFLTEAFQMHREQEFEV